jgi:hypothetical protein
VKPEAFAIPPTFRSEWTGVRLQPAIPAGAGTIFANWGMM